jgi:hypothetical protein
MAIASRASRKQGDPRWGDAKSGTDKQRDNAPANSADISG